MHPVHDEDEERKGYSMAVRASIAQTACIMNPVHMSRHCTKDGKDKIQKNVDGGHSTY